jgi:uncharacterized protein involved in exopolysaccharide biosynthesis
MRASGDRTLKLSRREGKLNQRRIISRSRITSRRYASLHVLLQKVAPPSIRHHAETPATLIADLMLADLRLSHAALAQRFDGISLR